MTSEPSGTAVGAAMRVLVTAIRDGHEIDDDALIALIEAQPDVASRKRLSCRLHALKLSTCEQHVQVLIRYVFRDGEAA